MKYLFLVLLTGCAIQRPSLPRPTRSAVLLQQQSQVFSGNLIPLVYAVPLNNCWLESSTNFVTWVEYPFAVETNVDGTTTWDVTNTGEPVRVFRIGGELQ